MTIAIDFDGTIVEHRYPAIGKELPFATATLRQLMKDGHKLVLWSVREGDLLQEAIDWCSERGVRFYADRLCLSPKYLTSLVKSVSGCTVQQLVFKAITKKAISLISTTDKSIKEIADLLNFPNSSAFGTFFKKQVGVSPTVYRQNEA